MNDASPDSGKRSNIYGLGGGDVQLSPQATAKTVGHETGHHFGLPDLYKGGTGEKGTLTQDAPGARQSLMGYGDKVKPNDIDKMIDYVSKSPMNNVTRCDPAMLCK